ncbi:MAG: sugar ABC transporter substrate-binding protein [Lachnospiraceae bacterium]|nr:sugar ABC transporter substrate-binding protein [Lachnospiraceae bacterium]
MKKKTKHYLTTILAAAAASAALLSGCGNSGDKGAGPAKGGLPELTADRYVLDASRPAWQLDQKAETTELTWYVNADWWNTDWGTDTVTKKIKEDLNLDVQFITGDDTKLNTFFAGGKKPDIITIFDANSSVAQSAAKWAWSLNELADRYDPYFYEVASKDSLNWFKLSDGKTYGYPDYSNGQDVYDSGLLKATTAFAIRKDIYEALGKPQMGTPEQFLSVLKEIKEKYPDLIPFGSNSMTDSTGSLGADFQNFIGVPIENADGTWYDRNMDEDYLAWIRTLSQAYREGLISDDNFSDDGTAHEDKVKTGKYACIFIGGTPQRSGPLQVWRSANPDAEYIAIDGPQSTVGNAPTLSQAGLSGWMVNYISKDCSDPIKAMEVFTYLVSDYGGLLCRYGVEGETYTINSDGLYELTPEVKEMKDNDNDKFKKVYRLSEFIVFGNDKYDAYSADVTESTVQMQEWGAGKLKPQFVIENISPDQGSAEARALSAVNTNWNTTLTSLIRSADDAAFDAVLAEHVAFRESNSWDAIVKIYNEKMRANREKLGK